MNVIAIEPIIDAELKWRDQPPAISLKFPSCWSILNVCSEFKCFTRSFRRGDEPDKFTRFAPKIFVAAPGNVFQSARGPIRHRCKNGSLRRRTICFPQINYDWLSCGQALESFAATGLPSADLGDTVHKTPNDF